jgi:endonuclease YncB( thermonuclease family)
VVYDRAPVSGSAVMTVDGEAFALTNRGPLIVGAESPLPAANSFAVSASSACGVVIEADGDKLLLFTQRGEQVTNRLQAIEARQ